MMVFMRALALISLGVFALAAAQQATLPAPLTKHFATLAAAPSLTVEYTVRTIGEAPSAYKLVLSRPGEFRLVTPTGFVLSDGKTVTTYTTAKKTYTQETYSDAWVAGFVKKPEVAAWGAYLQKDPATSIDAARAVTAKEIMTVTTVPVEIMYKKATVPVTLYIDPKIGLARGALLKSGEKEILVFAKTVEVGKEPTPAEQFAFVAPEGSKKEEVMVEASFAQVQTILTANCLPCHSADHHRGGFDLTNYAGVTMGVKPGDSANSLLVKAVKGAGARKMPPGDHSLTDAEIATIAAWIDAGAKQ